ncbi:ACS family tartrate transporter-like MFS transporter [Povalibacter uvarum]|uniref:ACS family tartrate transporter-like MFS transporter n=1 Tax=Povalibacter uvarum TaxID=732238 RepID=A0A841HRN3_9GAMM|nr:MFS transporter [Povalibacter uvarum]MBB6095917.1 ACS family tartrate transporter-like MFS transporter [Povalibacter uvarum]
MSHTTDRTPGESALRKVAWRLIPFLGALYFFAFLDRVNVGFAALTMNADLGLSSAVFGIGAGIFFLGYVAFEVPSNILLERFGARIWIARIMLTWGVLSAAMAFVQGPTSFYTVRFLLGIAEAGFFPGIIYYLTCWFPARHRARIIALFMIALPLSSVIGAPISTALLEIRAMGFAGWQWMFLLEAIPTIVLGVVVLFYLPDRPSEARWLTPQEQQALSDDLAAERAAHDDGHMTSLREALLMPRVWRHGLVYFSVLVGLYGFSFWLPQIIASLGSMTHLQVGLVTAIPYALACVALVLWGRHSDATGERALHVALPALMAAVALVVSGSIDNPVLGFAALCIAAIGIYCGLPAFWAYATAGLQGAAAAGAIALINSIGNIGGFLGPSAIGLVKERTGSYALSLMFIAACLAVGAGLVLRERARNAHPVGLLNKVSQ